MSCRCSICYAWFDPNKKQIHDDDDIGTCTLDIKCTKASHTCERGSILKPKTEEHKVKVTQKRVVKAVTFIDDSDAHVDTSKKPREHQKEAIDKFKDSNEIALFFEMGCGKTATTLWLAQEKYKQGVIDSLLVIAPNDVHRQWFEEQIPDWVSIPFEAQCVGGRGGAKTIIPFSDNNKLKIVCVNVDTFSQPHKWEDIVAWSNAHKCMIVLDEATSIKNVDSKRTQRILYEFNNVQKRGKTIVSSAKINPIRVILTGTPVTNGPMDLWSIMEFVKPNFFGRNWYSFKKHYGMFTRLAVTNAAGQAREIDVLLNDKTWQGIKHCKSYDEAFALFGCSQDTYFTIQSQNKFEGPYKHADELKEQLQTVAIFKKLTECVDMPDRNFVTRHLVMSPEQQACYNTMKQQQYAQYADHQANALNKLTMATRLQQISSGFIYDKDFEIDEEELDNKDLTPDEIVWIGKSNPKLDALMRDLAECDKPVIVLTRYSAEAAKIYDMCKDVYKTCLMTGWKRVGTTEDFKNGVYDVMVANTTCIARGFNFQISHTTMFYSNTFSMELRQQAEFRTFRMGQKNVCQFIDYVYDGTIDETIVKALALKKNLLEYFRDEDEDEDEGDKGE